MVRHYQVESSHIIYFRNPVETSVKEHLANFTMVKHGNEHRVQMHTAERSKQKQQKQNRTHFQNKNNEKPEKKIINQNKKYREKRK